MTVMRVTSVDYETDNGEVIVKLAGRDVNGERRNHRVKGTDPWMFAPANEPVPDESFILEVEDGYESFDGIPAKKVITKTPRQAGDLKDEFSQTWEADIPYYRRVSMQDDLSGYIDVPDRSEVHINDIDVNVDPSTVENIEPRVVIGDIEVIPDMETSIREMVEEGSQPITNITLYDNYSDEYTAFILDPNDDEEVSAEAVKETLLDHWGGGEAVERWVYDEEKMAYVKRDEVEVDPHTNGDINLEICGSETTLVKRFIRYIEEIQPDLISGWNWVDFDHEYLLRRIFNLAEEDDSIAMHALSDIGYVSRRKLNNPNHKDRAIECLPGFDMMDAFCGKMTRGEWRSRSLDYVAEEELDVGKVAGVSVAEAFESNRSLLAAYNIIDVQLCVELDEKHGVHEFFYQLSELSQIQISDAFREMRIVDGFIMSRRDDDELLPSAEEKDLEDNAGGLVLDPFDGISEWVGVVDLKSLYPSAIITWNISTETIDWTGGDWQAAGSPDLRIPWVPEPEDVEGPIQQDDIGWDTMASTLDKEGIIPKYLRMLFEVRAEFKEIRNGYDVGSDEYEVWDNRQRAVKIVMNSFYGVSSNDYWRLAREGMGDAITSAARYTLWQGIQITEEEGYEVLYGDTDSVMVSLADAEQAPAEIAPDAEVSDELRQTYPDAEETDLQRHAAVIETGFDLEETINDNMHRAVVNSGMPEDGEHPFLAGRDLHGTDQHCLTFEFEKLYRRFVQAGSKKRYAGLEVWEEGQWLDEPESDVTGFEAQRSSSPIITSLVQPGTIKLILRGGDFDEVSEYVQHMVEAIKSQELPLYHVAEPKSFGKPSFDDYGGTSPALRAVQHSNQHLGYNWNASDSVWMYHVDRTPAMRGTDVIALEWNDDLPEGYTLNVEKIVDKAIKSPLEPILEVAGFDFTELKAGGQSADAMADDSWGVDPEDLESSDDEGDDDDDWGMDPGGSEETNEGTSDDDGGALAW